MTTTRDDQPTPSDLASWVLDHGIGLTPARQKQLAKALRRAEARAAIRGRAVAIYQARAARAEKAEDENLAGWAEAQDGWRETDLRAERAEARLQAVRKLHSGVTAHDECEHCRMYTPCPTIHALDT